jgi:hypothetical protein
VSAEFPTEARVKPARTALRIPHPDGRVTTMTHIVATRPLSRQPGSVEVRDGFGDRRMDGILCAGEMDGTWLARSGTWWRMAAVDDPRLVGTHEQPDLAQRGAGRP